MSKEMVISANPHETRVAILEEGQLCEYYVEREKEFALVGSIYKGRVTRVLPGMQSAFVEIGLDSDAFLYVSDFLEGIEEFDDHIATAADDKIKKLEDQGGQIFPLASPAIPSIEPSDVESVAEAPGALHQSAAGETSSAPVSEQRPVSQFPPRDASAPDRPRFENRNRPGRDFGRRGGRPGGSGGRFGRKDRGGRSGPPRHGRELPSSKYASSGFSEDASAESNLPEGHVSVILPGESFAKYKEQPTPSPSASAASTVSEETFGAIPGTAPEIISETSAASTEQITGARAGAEVDSRLDPTASGSAVTAQDAGAVSRVPSRAAFQPPAFGGLEPLPGEKLAKFQRQETSASIPVEQQAPPVVAHIPEVSGISQADDRHELHAQGVEEEHFEEDRVHATPDAESVHEELSAAGLSEDEAAAIAEHVAEAQSDDAARDAQERSFAAADAAADSGISEIEEEELEEEEAVAEGEGMLAPPEESEESENAGIIASEVDAVQGEAIHSEEMTGESIQGEATHDEAISGEVLTGEDGSPIPLGNSLQQAPVMNARIQNDSRARMQHPGRRGGNRGRSNDRGRRPQHSHSQGGHSHHRTQPRRPQQLIADMLKQGEEIIVQIAKEPLGKKGARITSHIALPGRYLVYMPTLDHSGVSRKIATAEERSRLRHLVNDAKGAAGGGFIVRTAAASAPPEDVRADVEFLTRTWSEIKSRSEQRKAPSVLHRDLNLVERMLRDHMSSDYGAIWVDTEEEYTKVVDFMSRFQPALVNRVRLYTKSTPVFEEFGIQQEIDKGLRPKVWLKSGGYIVINHTEALVAIDVNTGKFVGKGSNRLEDTIVRTNIEAVSEIVRQMRLRDLGGIIVIDFIDMEERRNRDKVMAALEDALRADRAPSKVLRFNEFGLVAITRKRTKQALERTLCQPCPYCTGSGMVKSIPTLCYEIQTEARKMAADMGAGSSLTLRVHPEIAKAFKTRESSLIEELETWTKRSIIIQADPTLHWEQYDIY